jgi:hypothetical protein
MARSAVVNCREAALEALVEPPQSSLSGVARVLVHAGKLSSKAAEDLAKSAKDRRISFIGAVLASGAVSAVDLAHTLSTALALPLLDLSAVDFERASEEELSEMREIHGHAAIVAMLGMERQRLLFVLHLKRCKMASK